MNDLKSTLALFEDTTRKQTVDAVQDALRRCDFSALKAENVQVKIFYDEPKAYWSVLLWKNVRGTDGLLHPTYDVRLEAIHVSLKDAAAGSTWDLLTLLSRHLAITPQQGTLSNATKESSS